MVKFLGPLLLMFLIGDVAIANECDYWEAKAGVPIAEVKPEIDEKDVKEIEKGIDCLLRLEGNKSRGAFSGVTSFDISAELPDATVEICALYYISYLFFEDWKHAGGIALQERGNPFDKNSKRVVALAFESYRKWFAVVKNIGIADARKRNFGPLSDSSVQWFLAREQERPERSLQDSEIKPILVNELNGEFCSEIMANGLDYFSLELQNAPSSSGLIVFHGATALEGRNRNYFKAVVNYMRRYRGSDSVQIVRGNDENGIRVEIWQIPANGVLPKFEKAAVEEKITKTTLFDRSWADWHKDFGNKWTIYSYSWIEWGCEFDSNIEDFSEILKSNKNLTGYLIIYNSTRNSKKVKKFVIDELTKNYKLPTSRFVMITAKKREEPQLELWLVPKGESPPIQ